MPTTSSIRIAPIAALTQAIPLSPCLIISAEGVLLLRDGALRPVLPSHLTPWRRDAHSLHLALDPKYDPRLEENNE